jgi:hypothetical protein
MLALVAGQTVTQGFAQLRSEGLVVARRRSCVLTSCVYEQKKPKYNRTCRK